MPNAQLPKWPITKATFFDLAVYIFYLFTKVGFKNKPSQKKKALKTLAKKEKSEVGQR